MTTVTTKLTTLELGDVPMIINGQAATASSGWLDVTTPRDGQVIGRIPRAGAAEVADAVRAARAAFPGWRDRAPIERGTALRLIADAVAEQTEELALISSWENGNALRTQTRGEAKFVVDCFRYFSGLAQEAKGETMPLLSTVLDYTRREPIGVVGAIIPWNAPLMLAAIKIAPALVTGNTLVLKVAEDAPFAVLQLAQICQQFLDPGVLNVVTGLGREAGEALSVDPEVDKLSFTGSTGVGKLVMAKAAERVVPVSLELGGKSPQIVFPDADTDWAVQGVISGMRFLRQGQSCTAGSRLFVHRDIYESFTGKLVDALSQLRVGDPLDEANDMGSIVNQVQFDKVCDYIRDGSSQPGARLLLGSVPEPRTSGYYVGPTVIADVDNEWRIAREEVFGPVVVAIPWDNEDEVVAMANASHYGLAAYIWCQDLGAALRTAHRVESGWVQVNQGGGQVLGQSYGGFKQSGIGREFSLEGMLESYTQRKHISVNLTH